MKKTIAILMCTILSLFAANAQDATKARQILDKTAAIVNNKNGATANFKMTNGKTSASGKISIKGQKFQASTPEASVWYNGKTQWTYMKNTEEVNVSTPTEAQQSQMNPYTFITLYKTGYTLGMKNVSGGNEIHLVAKDKKRSIKEMYITINKKTNLPTKVRISNGKTWTDITISNFKTVNLSDQYFTFNPKDYPNAEVIDLR